jgi:hypothetical protein
MVATFHCFKINEERNPRVYAIAVIASSVGLRVFNFLFLIFLGNKKPINLEPKRRG